MKANLESRKSVRIHWFKQEKVPFIKKRQSQWSYNLSSVNSNELTPRIFMEYVFSNLEKPIPTTNIIVFANDLPQSYMSTNGSVGKKFSTEKIADNDVSSIDRIVKLEQGEENITKKPVAPHETHQYKEIQIHERKDRIVRKVTFKNETPNPIENMEVTFIENKEIRFIESKPAPNKSDAPEYTWNIEIPVEGTAIIELIVERYQKLTYKIERERKNDKYSNNDDIAEQRFYPNDIK